MVDQKPDPYGSEDPSTEYETRDRTSTPGNFTRSAWAVAVGAIVLAIIVWLVYLTPHDRTDPAPSESRANGGTAQEPADVPAAR